MTTREGRIFLKNLKKKILGALSALAIAFVSVPSVSSAESNPVSLIQAVLANYIQERNTSMDEAESSDLANTIIQYSYQYQVDPLVMGALFAQESNFHQSSISSAGAIGIGQIMPDTAVMLGVNPYDREENIEGACSYLSTQISNFRDTNMPVELALAAYNAGAGAVYKYGGIPPYGETQAYVKLIREKYFDLYGRLEGYMFASGFANRQTGKNISYDVHFPTKTTVEPKKKVTDVTYLGSGTQAKSVDADSRYNVNYLE